MHFAISSTWGPTDPTRAMLPFIFAVSALQAGDRVTLMLFHDAVLLAVDGAGAKLVPVGPPIATRRWRAIPGSSFGPASPVSMRAAWPPRPSTSASSSAA
jgi:hypothetical protein